MSAPDYQHTSILWAGPEVASCVALMRAQLFPDPWSAQDVEKLLMHPGSMAFLARLGSPLQTVGFVLAQIAADEAEILSLGVDPAHQRQGLGCKLIEAIRRAAHKSEVRKLFLEVGAANAAALGLYRKLGFAPVGARKGYYQAPGKPPQDAVVMALAL